VRARSGRIGSLIAVLVIGIAGIVLLLVAKNAARKVKPPTPREPATASTTATTTASAWYERGDELLKRAKDLRGASEAYRKAAELAPEMGVAHFGLGYTLLDLGDVDGAIAELESALSLAPPDAPWKKDAENALVLAHIRKSAAKPN
jgi:tetratricopeptide (TPR) repeat protein